MDDRTCATDGCNTVVFRRGYCQRHYRKLLAEQPSGYRKMSTLAEKVEARTNKTPTCWLWTGYKQTSGYGVLCVNKVSTVAHRLAYELAYGSIPEGMLIDHTCHTKACVRPDHLRPVTDKQNRENFAGLNASNTSGYRGVVWRKKQGKWLVQVVHNRRHYYGGMYSDIEEANAAAIALRKKLHTHNDLDRYETVSV